MRSIDKERKELCRGISQMVLKIVTKKANSRKLPLIHRTKIYFVRDNEALETEKIAIYLHNYEFFLHYFMWERSLSYKMSEA